MRKETAFIGLVTILALFVHESEAGVEWSKIFPWNWPVFKGKPNQETPSAEMEAGAEDKDKTKVEGSPEKDKVPELVESPKEEESKVSDAVAPPSSQEKSISDSIPAVPAVAESQPKDESVVETQHNPKTPEVEESRKLE